MHEWTLIGICNVWMVVLWALDLIWMGIEPGCLVKAKTVK